VSADREPALRSCADSAELAGRPGRTVVAAVLTNRGRVCLLRRSGLVDGDQGRWHCVTGYLPAAVDPLQQVFTEIAEETGMHPSDLRLVRSGARLTLRAGIDERWDVLPFLVEAANTAVVLNWENDDHRWVDDPHGVPGETVPWLADVLAAVRWAPTGVTPPSRHGGR
jgi:hypothetical protein